MSTAGNSHTYGEPGVTRGNALIRQRTVEESITNPTLGNGDGTYSLSISSLRQVRTTDDVVGVEWTGNQKVTVDSVSGNAVVVLFESPDAADSYVNEADGQVAGTLTVRARGA